MSAATLIKKDMLASSALVNFTSNFDRQGLCKGKQGPGEKLSMQHQCWSIRAWTGVCM